MTFLYGYCVALLIITALILRAWVRRMEKAIELLKWCLAEIDRLNAIIAERENDEQRNLI